MEIIRFSNDLIMILSFMQYAYNTMNLKVCSLQLGADLIFVLLSRIKVS